MEVVFLLVLPAALWAHSWYMLGFYTNPRTVGIIAAGVALILLGLVIFQPVGILAAAASTAALSALVLLWAFYAGILAAVALWGFDERTLGFYALFLWAVSLAFVLYFFVGDITAAAIVSTIMGITALLLSVLAALLFFHLAPPYPRLRMATGWFYLVGSIVVAAIGVLIALNGIDINV